MVSGIHQSGVCVAAAVIFLLHVLPLATAERDVVQHRIVSPHNQQDGSISVASTGRFEALPKKNSPKLDKAEEAAAEKYYEKLAKQSQDITKPIGDGTVRPLDGSAPCADIAGDYMVTRPDASSGTASITQDNCIGTIFPRIGRKGDDAENHHIAIDGLKKLSFSSPSGKSGSIDGTWPATIIYASDKTVYTRVPVWVRPGARVKSQAKGRGGFIEYDEAADGYQIRWDSSCYEEAKCPPEFQTLKSPGDWTGIAHDNQNSELIAAIDKHMTDYREKSADLIKTGSKAASKNFEANHAVDSYLDNLGKLGDFSAKTYKWAGEKQMKGFNEIRQSVDQAQDISPKK